MAFHRPWSFLRLGLLCCWSCQKSWQILSYLLTLQAANWGQCGSYQLQKGGGSQQPDTLVVLSFTLRNKPFIVRGLTFNKKIEETRLRKGALIFPPTLRISVLHI